MRPFGQHVNDLLCGVSSLGGSQRVGAIRLRQFGIDVLQGGQMCGHRSGVPSRDGSGQSRLTSPQSVLQSGPRERPDDTFGEPTRCIVGGLLPEQSGSGQRGA
jgi:hypothetical protein